MKLLITLLIGFLCFLSLAAQTPTKQGLVEYVVPDKGDTIHFYIYNPDNAVKTKIFLYIQGSGDLPMVNGDDAEACCYNNYPKKLMAAFPKEYAFVYIQKMGLPYYVRSLNDYKPGDKFNKRNNVIDRAYVADKVVNYLVKKVYPKAKIVAVLGHSEGSDVAAKLGVINKRVSHLGFSSGNGPSQTFNDILFLRRRMQKGEISATEAQAQLDALYTGLEGVYKNPESTMDYYNGDTYKWNSAINEPPLDNLLRLNIPILVTIGSNDDKVPVEASDYIRAEFIRHRKTNLTYKVYLNSNHDYLETTSDGKKIDHWNEMFMDFLKFVSETM
jgi:pimeloyl-ACP methyl ester carboxylesterase